MAVFADVQRFRRSDVETVVASVVRAAARPKRRIAALRRASERYSLEALTSRMARLLETAGERAEEFSEVSNLFSEEDRVTKSTRVLVTGAGGFIGHHLVKYLVKRGYWVRGVDVKEPEYEPTAAHEFEILDLRRWDACLQATRCSSGATKRSCTRCLAASPRRTELA